MLVLHMHSLLMSRKISANWSKIKVGKKKQRKIKKRHSIFDSRIIKENDNIKALNRQFEATDANFDNASKLASIKS